MNGRWTNAIAHRVAIVHRVVHAWVVWGVKNAVFLVQCTLHIHRSRCISHGWIKYNVWNKVPANRLHRKRNFVAKWRYTVRCAMLCAYKCVYVYCFTNKLQFVVCDRFVCLYFGDMMCDDCIYESWLRMCKQCCYAHFWLLIIKLLIYVILKIRINKNIWDNIQSRAVGFVLNLRKIESSCLPLCSNSAFEVWPVQICLVLFFLNGLDLVWVKRLWWVVILRMHQTCNPLTKVRFSRKLCEDWNVVKTIGWQSNWMRMRMCMCMCKQEYKQIA